MGSLYDDMMRRHAEAMNEYRPVAGWRFFVCDDCGERWKDSTRDYKSPSVETCPCGSDVAPWNGEPDSHLPKDRAGNLIGGSQRIFLAG